MIEKKSDRTFFQRILLLFQIKFPRGRYYLKLTDLLILTATTTIKITLNGKKNYKQELLKFFKSFYGKVFGLTCSSCRMALYLALKGLKLDSGDEVLMTPITIPDMLNMILLADLRPKFVDLNFKDHSVDIEHLKKCISSKSKVFLLTHISGVSQDVALIRQICNENNIRLIEDVSQSHGTTDRNHNKLGHHGDFTISSLTVGKSISAFVGGIVLCNDQKLFAQLESEFVIKCGQKTLPFNNLFDRYYDSLKVAFLTQSVVFSYITFYVIKFLTLMNWVKHDEIHLSIVDFKRAEKDMFLCDMPYKRDRLPESLFCDINQWQAAFALAMTCQHQKVLDTRRKKALQFLSQMSPIAKTFITLDLELEDHHNYYHIPFYIEDSEKLKTFKNRLLEYGIDTGGYSLSLCSELSEFSDLRCHLEKASKIYRNSIFIPLDDTLSKGSVSKLASIFNRVALEIS